MKRYFAKPDTWFKEGTEAFYEEEIYPEAELITMWFDLKDKEDRKAIKNLISHLQHQLQVQEEIND